MATLLREKVPQKKTHQRIPMKLLQKEHLVSVPQMLLSEDYLPKSNPDEYSECRPSGLNLFCAFTGLFLLSGILSTAYSPQHFKNTLRLR